MPAQGTSARLRSRRIIYGLIYAVVLQWSLPSHAETDRPKSEHRVVYRCVRDAVLTLTDVPCNGERVDMDLNRNLSAAPKPTTTPNRKRAQALKRDTATNEERTKQRERCDLLREQLGSVQSKLRRGYTAAAGIKLEERKRQLQARARSIKCSSS